MLGQQRPHKQTSETEADEPLWRPLWWSSRAKWGSSRRQSDWLHVYRCLDSLFSALVITPWWQRPDITVGLTWSQKVLALTYDRMKSNRIWFWTFCTCHTFSPHKSLKNEQIGKNAGGDRTWSFSLKHSSSIHLRSIIFLWIYLLRCSSWVTWWHCLDFYVVVSMVV